MSGLVEDVKTDVVIDLKAALLPEIGVRHIRLDGPCVHSEIGPIAHLVGSGGSKDLRIDGQVVVFTK
jgi:hypothetical protein